MGSERIAAKIGAMPEDCSCTDDWAPLNLTGIIMMLGCGGCGGFALSMSGDLDYMIKTLTTIRDHRDQGAPVMHPGATATAVRARPQAAAPPRK